MGVKYRRLRLWASGGIFKRHASISVILINFRINLEVNCCIKTMCGYWRRVNARFKPAGTFCDSAKRRQTAGVPDGVNTMCNAELADLNSHV